MRTRPSKQCEFCNYLLDKSLISQGCQSGHSSDSGLGGAIGTGGPGHLDQVVRVVQMGQMVQEVRVVQIVHYRTVFWQVVNINNFVFRGLGSMDNYIEYGVLTPDHTNLP